MPANPTLLWLLAGIALCLMELFLPTAFVEFMMGIAALLVALLSLLIPQLSLQILLWMILSTGLILAARRFLRPQNTTVREIEDSHDARVLIAIPAGETGRVLYEGNSWQARCEDEHITLGANQRVYVVRREGNTLIVVPETLLHS